VVKEEPAKAVKGIFENQILKREEKELERPARIHIPPVKLQFNVIS